VEIDLAIQSLFVTNKDGFVIESLECSESDAMKAAFDALIFLDKNQLISDDPFTPFEIKNGKLIRTHFSSCIKKTENDPEWGKLYKPENNGGCCGGCCGNKKNTTLPNTTTERTVKKSCLIRYIYKANNC
jgi:hypothetical protein